MTEGGQSRAAFVTSKEWSRVGGRYSICTFNLHASLQTKSNFESGKEVCARQVEVSFSSDCDEPHSVFYHSQSPYLLGKSSSCHRPALFPGARGAHLIHLLSAFFYQSHNLMKSNEEAKSKPELPSLLGVVLTEMQQY